MSFPRGKIICDHDYVLDHVQSVWLITSRMSIMRVYLLCQWRWLWDDDSVNVLFFSMARLLILIIMPVLRRIVVMFSVVMMIRTIKSYCNSCNWARTMMVMMIAIALLLKYVKIMEYQLHRRAKHITLTDSSDGGSIWLNGLSCVWSFACTSHFFRCRTIAAVRRVPRKIRWWWW